MPPEKDRKLDRTGPIRTGPPVAVADILDGCFFMGYDSYESYG